MKKTNRTRSGAGASDEKKAVKKSDKKTKGEVSEKEERFAKELKTFLEALARD